jgi:hypothetical protein
MAAWKDTRPLRAHSRNAGRLRWTAIAARSRTTVATVGEPVSSPAHPEFSFRRRRGRHTPDIVRTTRQWLQDGRARRNNLQPGTGAGIKPGPPESTTRRTRPVQLNLAETQGELVPALARCVRLGLNSAILNPLPRQRYPFKTGVLRTRGGGHRPMGNRARSGPDKAGDVLGRRCGWQPGKDRQRFGRQRGSGWDSDPSETRPRPTRLRIPDSAGGRPPSLSAELG